MTYLSMFGELGCSIRIFRFLSKSVVYVYYLFVGRYTLIRHIR